jgi:hypothetical protein
MIQVLTAFSKEPDNPEKVVADILQQLDLEHKRLKNAVGLLFGYVDFVNSGAVKALCAKLPFDVLGCTSQGFALHQAAEEIMLTLMVLTGDEVEFSAVLSEPLTPQTDMEANITELYRRAAAPLQEKPSLIFMFFPMSYAVLPGPAFEALDRESGGVPLFGSVAVDIATEIRTPQTIFNGETWKDRMSLVLITGIRDFKFFLMTLPRQDVLLQHAVVTEAEDNRIIALDHGPVINYFKKIGMIQEGGLLDIPYAFPLEVDFHDGKPPRTFAIYTTNPDGSISCGGSIPVGSIISLNSIGSKLVLETASRIANQIKDEWGKSKKYHGLLIIACFSRNVALADPNEEMAAIQSELADFPLPYFFLYAGGEYCPTHTETGQLANGFYQYSIIACLF